MLTDAAAIALALVAIRLARRPGRGHYTYGLKRVEILSAQANGITLVLLGLFFASRRSSAGRPASGSTACRC
jgi:cobalt-zinc-cadmium efflux system protein